MVSRVFGHSLPTCFWVFSHFSGPAQNLTVYISIQISVTNKGPHNLCPDTAAPLRSVRVRSGSRGTG